MSEFDNFGIQGRPADLNSSFKLVVFCVGNKLMLDDGLGNAVYEELMKSYDFPSCVEIYDVGCMSLDMVEYVNSSDYIITIDAVDGTESPAGTIYEYDPFDIEVKRGATASLHELTLADLFEAATLLGYEAKGKCFGMQVENPSPLYASIGLTPEVSKALPQLIDTLLAHLYALGVVAVDKSTNQQIFPGWSHAKR